MKMIILFYLFYTFSPETFRRSIVIINCKRNVSEF